MNQLTNEEFAEKLKTLCSKDLDTIGSNEKLRARIVFMCIRAAKKECDFFPKGCRASFLETAREARKLSRKHEQLSKARRFNLNFQYLLQEASRMKAHADYLCKCVRRFGSKNHDEGPTVLVMNVFNLKPDFRNWEALSRVLAQSYCIAGREKDSESITSDKLLRAAKSIPKMRKP